MMAADLGAVIATKYIEVPATFGDVRKIDAALVELLLEAGGVDPADLDGVELAVHEVCTNIVEHAYAGAGEGRIAVALTLETIGGKAVPVQGDAGARRLIVELQDTGCPFDPQAAPSVNLDQPQEGGYGLYLAHTLLDEVRYERRTDRNVWRLTKHL
jgi:serine/threonine-protein kinase RsbW